MHTIVLWFDFYKYALKDWDSGPTYTTKELGISDKDDFSYEKNEYAHLSLPFFSPENDLEVSVDQFIDTFLMDKITLAMLSDLFPPEAGEKLFDDWIILCFILYNNKFNDIFCN